MSLYERIREVAEHRARAYSCDPEWLIEQATRYVDAGKVSTAETAVAWAIHDLPNRDDPRYPTW